MGQELAEEEDDPQIITKPNSAFDFTSRFEDDEDREEFYEDVEEWGDEGDIIEEEEMSPEDLVTFNKFFPTQEDPLLRQGWGGSREEQDEEEGTNLADLILQKIAAHEASQSNQNLPPSMNAGVADDEYELPPKVIEVYTK